MQEEKNKAQRDVLKKLIAMCQQMMVDGMGDSEEAGESIKEGLGEQLAEGAPQEEAAESPVEEQAEVDVGEGDNLKDRIRDEMKKSNRSPVKSGRSVAIMVARPGTKMATKGRY